MRHVRLSSCNSPTVNHTPPANATCRRTFRNVTRHELIREPDCYSMRGSLPENKTHPKSLPGGYSVKPLGKAALALGELEALACALLPVLLALFHSRITRQ